MIQQNSYFTLRFTKILLWSLFIIIFLGQTVLAQPLLIPPRLNPGDTVGIISSGFRVPEDQQIQFAVERLQALGLKVKFGDYIKNVMVIVLVMQLKERKILIKCLLIQKSKQFLNCVEVGAAIKC